jgi:hypothetical protein
VSVISYDLVGERTFLHISRGDTRLPKKVSKKKKPEDGDYFIRLSKATVEKAMASFQEEMRKDPEGKKILKKEEKEVKKILKEEEKEKKKKMKREAA